jgi:antitoxin (DNA-binding transcriptional repressor) of toxin-antitoxin stability system
MQTKITATELARNLSDILNRVHYKGESFVVERNGETVALLEPPKNSKVFTVADFVEWWEKAPKPDPGFWDDVEEAHRLMNQPLPDPPSWQS